MGDFNDDGRPDLAGSILGSSTVSVRLNLGNGNFAAPIEYNGGGALVAADFTRDGRIDIAVSTPSGVQILRNTGNGIFAYGPFTPIGGGNMLAGDFSGAGSTDIAITTENGLFLLRNRGDGVFNTSQVSQGNFQTVTLTKADFNGDGILDFASAGTVYLNKGDGAFTAIAYPVGDYAQGVASADFNKDGKPDLAWANFYSNRISVVLNDYVRTNIAALNAPDLSYYYDSGRSHFDNITNGNAPQFSGQGGEPGLTVMLYADGVEVGRSCVDEYGNWSVTASPLADGTHVIRVRQGNAFGTSLNSPALNVTIDTIAPAVTSAVFEYNSAPHQVTVGYSEDVSWSLGANDFQLSNLTTGAGFTLAHSYYGGRSHVQSIASRVLPDGNYTFTVKSAGVQDIAGNVLVADYDLSFFVFAADANRDRKVDAADVGILAANWQGSGMTFSQGDFNYDGKVDINDLYILASKYQQTLPPPPPLAIAAVTQTPTRRTPTRVAAMVI